jgi:acyl-CoA thioester hydrolase
MTLTGTLKDGVHRLDIRVYYEDTDHSGRVYHANYLKFCERGRSETLKCAGIEHTALAADDLYFIVRHMDCDFLGGCGFIDDIVTVETRLLEQGRAKFVLEQSVLRGARCCSAPEGDAGDGQRPGPSATHSPGCWSEFPAPETTVWWRK